MFLLFDTGRLGGGSETIFRRNNKSETVTTCREVLPDCLQVRGQVSGLLRVLCAQPNREATNDLLLTFRWTGL